ncbi:MAG: tyrosine-protein phosphatase, partial [Acidobacteriota bacterium]
NFDVVLGPGGLPVLYRGGQPHTCGELESLRALGVKSILKLNACGSRESDEERKAKALGFRVLSLDFNALNIGTSSTCSKVGEALAFLKDPDNVPVFVHCAEGKDRTGYIVGLYEKTFLHTPTADVLSELHCHGHRGLLRSLFMGQIPRELAREVPACSTSIPSRSEMTGGRGPDS